jgi:hypothetical protein
MTDPSADQARDTRRAGGQSGDDPADALSGGEGSERADANASGSWKPLSSPESVSEEPARNMIPARLRRPTKLERGSMRVLATGGIVGLATVLGAILASQDVAGWIVGLTVGLTSVILAALLWSSRQL